MAKKPVAKKPFDIDAVHKALNAKNAGKVVRIGKDGPAAVVAAAEARLAELAEIVPRDFDTDPEGSTLDKLTIESERRHVERGRAIARLLAAGV